MELVIASMAFLAVFHRVSRFLHSHRIPLLLSHLHDIQFPILCPHHATTRLFLPLQQCQTNIISMCVLNRKHIGQNGVIGLNAHQPRRLGMDLAWLATLLNNKSVLIEIGTNDALDLQREHRKPFFQWIKKMGAFCDLSMAKRHPKRSTTSKGERGSYYHLIHVRNGSNAFSK